MGKYNSLITLFSAVLIGTASPVWAAEITSYARVNIVPALSLQALEEMDFGALAATTSHCSIDDRGKLSGSNVACSGSGTPGKLLIRGVPGSRVNVSATTGIAAGIRFEPNLREQSITLDRQPNVIDFGGKLSLEQPQTGALELEFQIVANFE